MVFRILNLAKSDGQAQYFLSALHDVKLVENSESLTYFDGETRKTAKLPVLRNEVLMLEHYLESFETWGVKNEFSDRDPATYRDVRRITAKLINFCTRGDGNGGQVPNAPPVNVHGH